MADLPTHVLPLEQGPAAYDLFQKKLNGAIKVLLKPWPADTAGVGAMGH